MTAITPLRPTLGPINVEAEQQLIGALLLDNARLDALGIRDTTFGDPVHAEIFRRMKAMIDAGQLCSPVTMQTVAQEIPGLTDLGGTRYLARMAASAAPSAALRDYAGLLMDLEAKRDLLTAIGQTQGLIADGQTGAAEIAIKLETAVGKTVNRVSSRKLIRSYAAAAMAALEQVNEAYQGGTPPGVETGIRQLDRMLSNFRPGQMIVMGARPSMGKTTVAQNIAYNVAASGGGVFYGSLEMTGEELSPRMISKGLHLRGVDLPYNRILRGEMSELEMRHYIEETQRQINLPIIVGEREVRDVGRFRSAVKRARQELDGTQTPLKLVIVDYVQQLDSGDAKSVYDRASRASDLCKSLAMEMGIPVLALAQLSRQVEQRDPPIPNLSDLRETGKLEEDADVVMFCYRDAYYLERKIEAVKGSDLEKENDLRLKLSHVRNALDLIVAKQRSGPIGTVQAYADLAFCHVTSDRAGDAHGDQGYLI